MTTKEALAAATDTKSLVIEQAAIGKVAQMFKQNFPNKRALIVADNNTWKAAGFDVHDVLDGGEVPQEEPFIYRDPELYAEYGYVDELIARLKTTDAIPVAVGSGTINDLTKLASHLTGRQYLCVATAASVDGYTSYGASITYKGAKQTFDCPAPRACIADTLVIGAAPKEMTAAGYADLFAKVTAGADWLLADYLGLEPIDHKAWDIVQDSLQAALANPGAIKEGRPDSIRKLIKGLIMSGFAMQAIRSSRPASGAEHYFSHLWDMEGHRFNGKHVSHGFQVSMGTVAETALWEALLEMPLDKLDIDALCRNWYQTVDDMDKVTKQEFGDSGFLERCLNETHAKYVTPAQLAEQLRLLAKEWKYMRSVIEVQLLPLKTVCKRLQLVGAPYEPEQIGITRQRLRASFLRAPFIRSRFTVLDLAWRTGTMDASLNKLFGKGGRWEI